MQATQGAEVRGVISGQAAHTIVAKYFYFTCLDEQVSFSASLKALSELKANGWLSDHSRWIQTLSKWKPKLKQMRGRAWPDFSTQRGFAFDPGFDMGAWSNFVNTGEPSEIEAVLFSQILGFRDGEIAMGLGVTVGTVRYRVGRGLRHLGGFLES